MYCLIGSYLHPTDPDAFLEYYRTKHVAIGSAFPKARSYTWTLCESVDGTRPPHFLVAVITWDTKEDALAALASPEGQAALADLPNFAGAGVEVDWGEVVTEV